MAMEKSKEIGEVKKIDYGEVALGFNLIRGRAKLIQEDKYGITRSRSARETIFRADRADDVVPTEDWKLDLSKLDIKDLKAQGTHGTVYRGTYGKQDVAVKLLNWGEDGKATSAETAAVRAAFRQKVSVWHKLDHPNVTKFVGASIGTSDIKIPSKNSSTNEPPASLPASACCIVVEFLPGGTLKDLLYKNRKKKLPFKTMVQLALDLARGLSYLHSNKIVHRDVKAENMLLDARRNLKIADFGVARVEALNHEDMSGETGPVGYIAPEVIDGKPYSMKCDVYSFAICLWEIYCCDLAYANLSLADMSSQVVQQNLRPPIPKCCPSAFADIMRKCWDANPEKRPSMDEAVKFLEDINIDEKTRGCFCFTPGRGH